MQDKQNFDRTQAENYLDIVIGNVILVLCSEIFCGLCGFTQGYSQMTFLKAINTAPFILAEGSIIERLHRDPSVHQDPHIRNAGLIYTEWGRSILEEIYRGYLDIGYAHNLPMLIFAPTWRTNPERLRAAGFGDDNTVNQDCLRFMMDLRKSYHEYSSNIYIGGLMGPYGDAYDPSDALSIREAAEFHRKQSQELADAGVDFLMAETLPALTEAIGISQAMANTGIPYIPSFIISKNGTLLDGTPLHQAIAQIDNSVNPNPIGFMINCVHSTVFAEAMHHEITQSAIVKDRILGLKANTSSKSPEELNGSADLDTCPPDQFAAQMIDLHCTFGTKILGGCCGTNHHHIQSIVKKFLQL